MKKLNSNVLGLANLAIETRVSAEKDAERKAASLRTGVKGGIGYVGDARSQQR